MLKTIKKIWVELAIIVMWIAIAILMSYDFDSKSLIIWFATTIIIVSQLEKIAIKVKHNETI